MILIVTNAHDLTTDYIVLELQRRGTPYFRLNSENLPQARLTLGLRSDTDWTLELDGRQVTGEAVTGAYFRRPGAPEIDPGVINDGERSYCASEWAAVLKSLYLRLGPLWLNSPEAIGLAEDKPRQLVLAMALGFETPEAIVTNDATRLAAFVEAAPSIAKPLREALLEGEAERVIFTSRVDRATARDARAIAAAPFILQREIPKATDVRVTVVGDRVFSAAIHSQADEDSTVDWRRGDSVNLRHEVISLPEPVAMRCVELVRRLGLRYGAIDLVEDLEGRFWFLECNPNGQWAWIENRTGLPIAAAIVDQLQALR